MNRSSRLAVVLLTISSAAHATNLVVNGSFENIGGALHSFSINNPTVLPGWTARPSGDKVLDCLMKAGESMSLCGTAFEGTFAFWEHPGLSPDGGNFVGVDGDAGYATPLTQSISGLIVGANYAVSFYQAAGQQNNRDGATTERWRVSFGGGPSQLSTKMYTPNHGHVDWMSQTLNFTATATTQILTFLAVGTPNGAPPFVLLDGVSVEQVPEPGTLGMILLGLATVPLARRCWKTKQ